MSSKKNTRLQHKFRASRQSLATLGVLMLCLVSSPANAAKTDNVRLINGNVITGEIKALDFGSLRYSTDSMGTVRIDWEDILGISSDQTLQLEKADGTRYFGSLIFAGEDANVLIKSTEGDVTLPLADIVRITPIVTDERFIDRLDGSLSFGMQAQKSSEVTTSSLHASTSYRTRKYLVGVDLRSTITDQPTEETSASQSSMLNYQRFRQNRWYTDWFAGWEKNDELGLNGRTSIGGAVGRYLIQSNRNLLSLTAGVQGARSSFIGEDESTTEAEGRFELRYQRRRLVPETSVTITTRAYPLLKDLSQYRGKAEISFKRELIEDLFLEFQITYDYVSESATGAANSDYTMTTSVGYSF